MDVTYLRVGRVRTGIHVVSHARLRAKSSALFGRAQEKHVAATILSSPHRNHLLAASTDRCSMLVRPTAQLDIPEDFMSNAATTDHDLRPQDSERNEVLNAIASKWD